MDWLADGGVGQDRGRRQRRIRTAGRDLGVARGGACRADEPGGADRGGLGVVRLDGPLARARRRGHAARAPGDLRQRLVPAGRGHRQGRDRDRRHRAGDRPRRVRRAGRGREAELPGLEGDDRRARGDARRHPRDRLSAARVAGALPAAPTIRLGMATLEQLAEELERSHAELEERLADPSVYADPREAANLGRRLKELDPALRAAREWRQATADLADAKGDPELSPIAGELETEVARLEDELRLALVERDPADAKDVIVEVRQGVGGDEAALWAAEVARMLQRYAERRGFRTEVLSASESDGGGVKEQ